MARRKKPAPQPAQKDFFPPETGPLPEVDDPNGTAVKGFEQVAYPSHSELVTYDEKGEPSATSCRGPLLLVEQGGMPKNPRLENNQVVCAWCKDKAGVMVAHDETYMRVLRAARASGFNAEVRPPALTLGRLGKEGRLALAYAAEGKRDEARMHLGGLKLLRLWGLVNDSHEPTPAGVAMAMGAGWSVADKFRTVDYITGGASAAVH